MPGLVNAAGQFNGSQARLNGLLTASVVAVYLGSIGQRPHFQGHVPMTLSDGQGASEGLLGSNVVTFLHTQE